MQKVLETIILNNGLAAKYVYSDIKEGVSANGGTDIISIKPDKTGEIWVMTKLIFGNINSAVWEVTIDHKSFESFSEQTVEASFVEEVIDTWIEITPAQKFDIKIKNTDTSTQNFDITAFMLVFTDVESYNTVKRMIAGVSNLLSMLGFISSDPALHKHIIITAISKLLSSPPEIDSKTEEVISGSEADLDRGDQGITLFEENIDDKKSPGFLLTGIGDAKDKIIGKSIKL